MEQRVVIHIGGGIAKENYNNYFSYLWHSYFTPKHKSTKKWHDCYEEKLASDFEIIKFQRIRKNYADYQTWKKQFEDLLQHLDLPIILVGHSLGGSFILKYLDENIPSFHIDKILIIAPGIKDSLEEKLGSFHCDMRLESFKKYQDITKVYYSKDDPVVAFSEHEIILKALPDVKREFFSDRGHFLGEEFDEIFRDIKNRHL